MGTFQLEHLPVAMSPARCYLWCSANGVEEGAVPALLSPEKMGGCQSETIETIPWGSVQLHRDTVTDQYLIGPENHEQMSKCLGQIWEIPRINRRFAFQFAGSAMCFFEPDVWCGDNSNSFYTLILLATYSSCTSGFKMWRHVWWSPQKMQKRQPSQRKNRDFNHITNGNFFGVTCNVNDNTKPGW